MPDDRTPITAALIMDFLAVDENREMVAQVLWPAFFDQSRGRVLPETKDYGKTRWLLNGADITANQAGTQVAAKGESFADRINIIGGGAYWSNKPESRQLNVQAGGAGADCLFDYLVSSCFAALAGFVEGNTYSSLSGCTFKGYSTIQGAATAVSALVGGSSAVLAICSGTYNEDVLFSGPVGTGLVTVYGTGRTSVKIVGQAAAGAAFACTTASVKLHLENLTITGHTSANSTAINGDATNSQWSLRNVDIVTGADAAAVGVDTAGGTALTRWRFEMCSLTGSGIGFGDRGGGSADAWGNVELHNCYVATAIAADFVGDANFWMVGGRVTGAIGFRCNAGTASSLLICDQVDFTCATSAVQIANAISFNDLQMQGCFFDSCATALDFSGSVASTARRYRVEDCHFKAVDANSIGVNDPSGSLVNAVILGNTFEGYTTPKEVTGRTAAQWIASGVQIAHNATDSGTPVVDTGLGHPGSGSGMSPSNADPFVTIGAVADLSAERALTAGSGVGFTDGGANSTVTLNLANLTQAWRQQGQFGIQQEQSYASVGSLYAMWVYANNPTSFWRLGESSGSFSDTNALGAASSTLTANGAGITRGVAGALVGDPNTAITLHAASSEYLSVATNTSVDLSDFFTVEFWAKLATLTPAANMTVVSKGTNGLQVFFDTTGHLALALVGTGTIVTATSAVPDTTGWHHFVVTKNGATVVLYQDNVVVTGVITNQTCLSNALALNIGRETTGANQFFDGSLDEISLYKSATLSATVVGQHYTAGTGATATPPITALGVLQSTRLGVATAPPAGVSGVVALTVGSLQTAGSVGIGSGPTAGNRLFVFDQVRDPSAQYSAITGSVTVNRTLPSALTAVLNGLNFSLSLVGLAPSAGAASMTGIISVIKGAPAVSVGSGGGTITISDLRGLYVPLSVAASSTVTSFAGIYAANPTGAGTVTTNYALYAENQTKGGTNWVIYSLGGNSSHLGAFTIGSNTAPASSTLSLHNGFALNLYSDAGVSVTGGWRGSDGHMALGAASSIASNQALVITETVPDPAATYSTIFGGPSINLTAANANDVYGLQFNLSVGGLFTLSGKTYGMKSIITSSFGNTITNAYGFFPQSSGAGLIVNWYGVYIPAAGVPTTNFYGLYLESTGGYPIYSAGGQSAHLGAFSIGALNAPNGSAILDLTNVANRALLWPAIATASRPAGVNGLTYYDSTTGKFVGYENGAYVNLRAVGAVTETEQSFGATPTHHGTWTVTDATVAVGSKIVVNQSGAAPTGKSADENEMDKLVCVAVPAAGSFTLYATAMEGPVVDNFKFNYALS